MKKVTFFKKWTKEEIEQMQKNSVVVETVTIDLKKLFKEKKQTKVKVKDSK